jgi:hypothetical protein
VTDNLEPLPAGVPVFASYDEYVDAGVAIGIVLYGDGKVVWHKDGLIHRDTGPAVYWIDPPTRSSAGTSRK